MPLPFENKLSDAIPPVHTKMNNVVVDIQDFFTQPTMPIAYGFNPDDDALTDEKVNAMADNIVKYEAIPKPTMMQIGRLLETQAKTRETKAEQRTFLLLGCDSFASAHFACMNGAIRQVASQFNSGEAKSARLTPPNQFKWDATQGPAEQRTCGRAAIARYAYRAHCDSFGVILSDEKLREAFLKLFDYKFGYLIPLPQQEQACLTFLKKHIDDLALNVERVIIDNTNPPVQAIQVLNASLALGGYDVYDGQRTTKARLVLNQINQLLLDAQYMAVAKIAMLEAAANPNRRIPVSFTFVGGSAFGADQSIIASALNQAIKAIKSSKHGNIDICLSCWSNSELSNYKTLAKQKNLDALHQVFTQSQILTENMLKERTELNAIELIPSVKTSAINQSIIAAMQASINSLSKSCLLKQGEYETKRNALGLLLTQLEENASDENLGKECLYEFMVLACEPRQASWNFFTSKFGETASARAFYKNLSEGAKGVLHTEFKIPYGTSPSYPELIKQLKAQKDLAIPTNTGTKI